MFKEDELESPTLVVAIFFLGCVLNANDRRRPGLKFYDWLNDWSLTFDDWFQEGVSVISWV